MHQLQFYEITVGSLRNKEGSLRNKDQKSGKSLDNFQNSKSN